MYVFQIFDSYSASGIILLTICCCECMVIGWVYGANRFYDNIAMMLGRSVFPYFKYCWKFITPTLTLVGHHQELWSCSFNIRLIYSIAISS